MTTMRSGTAASASAPVESTMRLPSNLKPGISIGREPVAMTMLSACDGRRLRRRRPSTSTVLRATSFAVPVRSRSRWP